MLVVKKEHIKDLESMGFEHGYRCYLYGEDELGFQVDEDTGRLVQYCSTKEAYEDIIDLDLIYDLIMKGWVERV